MLLPRHLLIALSIVLATVLLFGGIAHALIPHSHSDSVVVTDLLHSAIRHEEKQFIDLSFLTVLFFVPVLYVVLYVSRSSMALRFIQARAHSSTEASLRRGIAHYRRFR